MGRTAQELYEEGKARVLGETEITNLSPGSVARTLLQVYSQQNGEFYRYVDDRVVNAYVSTASGRFLDLIGELVGQNRVEATFANGVIRFYVNQEVDLSFADILALLNQRDGGTRTEITIPAGTTVRASDRSYVTTTNAVLTSSSQGVEVDVIATLAGSFGNTEQGSVRTTVWNDPVLSLLEGIVNVTNDAPIESARDTQTDSEYRFFITNAVVAGAKANETAIRLAILSTPGVADVSIQNYAFGVGTFAAYVTSTSPITTTGTIAAVQQAINFTQAAGIRGVALSPDLVGVQMNIALEFVPTTRAADKTAITKQVINNVVNYVNNLRPGDELVITEVQQRIMDTSDLIHDHTIISMSIGDYNIVTGVIDNADNTIAIANQTAQTREKFISNKNLIMACCIS